LSHPVCSVRCMNNVVLEQLSGMLERLDPDAVPLCEAPDLWRDFDRAERLLGSAKTLLARRVDESEVWRRAGLGSAAEYLAGVSGTSISSAQRQLVTSRRVRKLPKTAAAMRTGMLSSEKAEAIASAATVDTDAEAKLLEGAEAKPLAEVREACLKAKAKDRDKAHARIKKNRYARAYTDGEGAWNFRARGTLDAGVEFRSEWKRETDRQFKLARAEGREEPLEAYAFDALMELARRSARADDDAVPDSADADDATTTKPKRPAAKYVGIIRLDYAALVRGAAQGDETCDIRGLGPIPVHIARELLGEATLKLVITKGVDVVNVTHLGRSPTVVQQVALWWESHMCTRDTCTRTERLENDHGPEWRKTKHTRVRELDPVCDRDHDLKSNHGWDFVKGHGRRAMVPPGDPRHPNYSHPKYRPPQRT
jgi:hypothetical protein